MGLFKGLGDKPYTKAEYYREMEERQAAKIAAKAAPVVVVPVRDPEWLEPEVPATELTETITEEVVIPFVEPSVVSPAIENEPKITLNAQVTEPEFTENVAAPPPKEEEKPVKVVKQKRKKTG